MEIIDGVPTSKNYEHGGNLQHWRELPMFQKAGGTADVFKEYNLNDGKYRTRGITEGLGIKVTQNDDDIEVKIDPDGWWGDVTVSYTPIVGSTQDLTLRFQAGSLRQVFLGTEIIGTEAAPGTAVLSVVDTDT